MRKLILSAVGAGALALTALASPAAQAHTVKPANLDSECTAAFYATPDSYREDLQTISLGVQPRKVDFSVALYDPVHSWHQCPAVAKFDLQAGGGDRNLYIHATTASPTKTIVPSGLENSDAGDSFGVDISVLGTDGNYYDGEGDLTLKRATQITKFNASPEPVRKGNQILNTGTLLRANWETGAYAPYAGRTLTYQDRDFAGGPYVDRGTAGTRNSGFAAKSVTADITRVHRFIYKGNDVAGATYSSGDKVVVTTK